MRTRWRALGIVVTLVVTAGAGPAAAESIEELLAAVSDLLLRGRPVEAASRLETAPAAEPGDRLLVARAGAVISLCRGDRQEAERRLGGLLGADAEAAAAVHLLLGDLRLTDSDFEAALLHYRSALAAGPASSPPDLPVLAWGTRWLLSRARALGLDGDEPPPAPVQLGVASYIELDDLGRQLLEACPLEGCPPERRIADLARLAWLSTASGFHDDAVRWQAQALEEARSAGEAGVRSLPVERLELAAVHLAAGHSSEALRGFREVADELSGLPGVGLERLAVPLAGCVRAAASAGARAEEKECRRLLAGAQRGRPRG